MSDQQEIKPEQLPAEEDFEKLDRHVKTEEKKLGKNTDGLPDTPNTEVN